jgi:hypothetical protein
MEGPFWSRHKSWLKKVLAGTTIMDRYRVHRKKVQTILRGCENGLNYCLKILVTSLPRFS